MSLDQLLYIQTLLK